MIHSQKENVHFSHCTFHLCGAPPPPSCMSSLPVALLATRTFCSLLHDTLVPAKEIACASHPFLLLSTVIKQKLVWGHLHSTRTCSLECSQERVDSRSVTCCDISSSSETYLLQTASPLRSATEFCRSFYREETCVLCIADDQDEKMLHCNLVARS